MFKKFNYASNELDLVGNPGHIYVYIHVADDNFAIYESHFFF